MMTAPVTPDERAAMRDTAHLTKATVGLYGQSTPTQVEVDYADTVLRLLNALDTAEAERDEARAASARVREAAARCVADEAAESDLTITRQRDRLRAREEQVRRLRAEVTRLHALVATERAARPAPVWDEDTVRAEALAAVDDLESDYDFDSGHIPGGDAYVDAALAVVREHLPVRPDRETVARAIHAAHRPTTGPTPAWDAEAPAWRQTYLDFADAALDAWPGESRAKVQVEALRDAADDMNARLNGPALIAAADKWGGYYHGVRTAIQKEELALRARIDRIEKGETR